MMNLAIMVIIIIIIIILKVVMMIMMIRHHLCYVLDKPHDGPFYGDDDDYDDANGANGNDHDDNAVVHQLESTNLRLIRDWRLI